MNKRAKTVSRKERLSLLEAMTQILDKKIEEWNFLEEEIEALTVERKQYAKRYRLPLPEVS